MNPSDILDFWFEGEKDYNEFWFDRTKDSYITSTYSEILHELEKKEEIYNNWTCTDEGTFAAIIVFDQFSRSIYRGKSDYNKNDEIAFSLSKRLLNNRYDVEIPLSKRIFLLLPFRHQKDSNLLDIVMEKLEKYENELGPSSLLTRFRKATIMSYTPLTDRIEMMSSNHPFHLSEYEDVLDPKCMEYKVDESNEYLSRLSEIVTYPLYKTLQSFIIERRIKNIGVSLSGGVDSMVICFLLRILKIRGEIENVYAMHLEYKNRKESPRETEMISLFCGMIDVPLFIRSIYYMKRETTERSFYEEETRKIRFATYQHLSEKYNISGWCLGHHHGDLSENVLMNLCNGRDILDLTVMKKDSTMEGVKLYRPLLERPKIDIYHTAHDYHIPYTKDTTPDWSCRGVIRRKLLPAMKDQWKMIEQNLTEIGKQSEEWSYVVDTFVMEPLKKTIKMNSSRDTVEFIVKKEYSNLPKVVWMNLFLYIFHNMGVNMISRKNLSHFMDMFTRNIEKQHRFMFSNDCIGFFMGESKLKIVKINK